MTAMYRRDDNTSFAAQLANNNVACRLLLSSNIKVELTTPSLFSLTLCKVFVVTLSVVFVVVLHFLEYLSKRAYFFAISLRIFIIRFNVHFN